MTGTHSLKGLDAITGKRITPHQIAYAALITDIILGSFANKVKMLYFMKDA